MAETPKIKFFYPDRLLLIPKLRQCLRHKIRLQYHQYNLKQLLHHGRRHYSLTTAHFFNILRQMSF